MEAGKDREEGGVSNISKVNKCNPEFNFQLIFTSYTSQQTYIKSHISWYFTTLFELM